MHTNQLQLPLIGKKLVKNKRKKLDFEKKNIHRVNRPKSLEAHNRILDNEKFFHKYNVSSTDTITKIPISTLNFKHVID